MSDDLTKLRQVVLLLSSEHDGEVVGAARAINRLLGSAGKDWHWFAASIGVGEPSVHPNGARQTEQPVDADAFEDCSHAGQWLLDNFGAVLRDREADFCTTMASWNGWPTEKQAQWLNALCRRYGYRKP